MNDFNGKNGETLDFTHDPAPEMPVEHNTYHLGEIVHELIKGRQQPSEPDADQVGGVTDMDDDDAPPANAMSEDDLKSLIAQKIYTSEVVYQQSTNLVDLRVKADMYYRGEPIGTEMAGRSQVVSRDVAEAVDSIMPSLMRIFCGGDRVVSFQPFGPEDEEKADQATDYINYVFMEQNNGFLIMHTWFKDALLKKNGVLKTWYDVRWNRTREQYQGLSREQLASLQMDAEISVQDITERQEIIIVTNPQDGQLMQQPVKVFDCAVVKIKPEKRIRVMNVPPDEFIIEARATGIDTANFLAHRSKYTVDELILMGFDRETVENLPFNDGSDNSQERIQRFRNDEQGFAIGENDWQNLNMRKVWVAEVYIKVDYDGDGYAEWRKVFIASANAGSTGTILSNEEVDDHPFSSITPIPEPHKFRGLSLFDQVKDIQDNKTALLRGAFDSIYLANAPRLGVVEGGANVDDLLDVRPGGIVRLKNPTAIVQLPTVSVAPQAFTFLEYMDTVREARTGITRYNQGLNADSLNKTATGVQIINNAGVQRQEMIARVFAETGVKDLFRKIFKLSCQYEDKPRTVKLRGKWTDVNPRDWKDRMDVVTTVGIGTGDKQQQAQVSMQMLNLAKEVFMLQGGAEGPLIGLDNVYNMLAKLVEAIGWKNVEPYFKDPRDMQQTPQQPKPPSPDEQKDMLQVKAKEFDVEIKRLEFAMKQLDFQMRQLEAGIAAEQLNAAQNYSQGDAYEQ